MANEEENSMIIGSSEGLIVEEEEDVSYDAENVDEDEDEDFDDAQPFSHRF